LNIGLDDIDTPGGGCTTHLGALLVSYLMENEKCRLLDYPSLVRLNPGIPWKTRGNASVAIRIDNRSCRISSNDLMEISSSFIDSYQGTCKHRNSSPGIVVYEGYPWSDEFRDYYFKALTDIVLLEDARKFMDKHGVLYNSGRGVIGALAAIGALGPGDPYTFELLAYRDPLFWGKKRHVDYRSVLEYDVLTGELTFSNVDYTKRTQIITPHGPDPVYYGIRGTDPEKLLIALKKINGNEPIHGWCIYRSNQATSIHEKFRTIPRYYRTSKYDCTVLSRPKRIPGGHTIVEAKCEGVIVSLAFYRESYPLNNIALMLIPGDHIMVTGPVKQRSISTNTTITVEVLYIEELSNQLETVSPRCPKCGARMKSKGSGKGYACPKCGYYDRNARKLIIPILRNLVPGRYTPTPMHITHLVSPNWSKISILSDFPLEIVNGFCGKNVNSPVNNPFISYGTHQ
jgi:tRNA(Ile2)-agmatinylcytidine synthase